MLNFFMVRFFPKILYLHISADGVVKPSEIGSFVTPCFQGLNSKILDSHYQIPLTSEKVWKVWSISMR